LRRRILDPRRGDRTKLALLLLKKLTIDTSDRANCDRMSEWLHEQADLYSAAIKEVAE
jgi:hypothetical protein